MKKRKQVTIIQMAHHFLYLPVHYALHVNCFGYVPDHYELCLERTPSGTDQEAYRMLMKKSIPGHDYIGFAVGDPAELLHDRDSHPAPPIVLAGIITNSAFWAVDRRTHDARFLTDLAKFNKIITYKKGTTSYGIAKRIYRLAQKEEVIKPVSPGKELTLLTSSPKGTMALSPDILGIDKLMSEEDGIYRVELALGQTPEYNNVLVTALLSRTDVLNDHPELVCGLLKAIQRSLLLVRRNDSDVIRFAMDTYGESEMRIKGALSRAEVVQVYPASIEVSQAQWENAARAAADAVERDYDTIEHDRAHSIFLRAVLPYQHLIKREIQIDVVSPTDKLQGDEHKHETPNRNILRGRIRWWIGFIILILGFLLTFKLSMNIWVLSFHIFWLIVGLSILVWWAWVKPESSKLSTPVWGWLGIELTILLTAASTKI